MRFPVSQDLGRSIFANFDLGLWSITGTETTKVIKMLCALRAVSNVLCAEELPIRFAGHRRTNINLMYSPRGGVCASS